MTRLLVGCLIGLTAFCAPSRPSAQDPIGSTPWVDRLEQLDPARPLEYFELGEEIADLAEEHSDQQQLAIELFALAGQLDFKRLGRSSILAIAAFTSNPIQKRRLLDAADLLSAQRHFRSRALVDDLVTADAKMDFGMVLAALRLEDWDQANDLLRDPELRAMLQQNGDLLGLDSKALLLELEAGRVTFTGDLKRHLLVEWSVLDRSGLDWSVELEVSNAEPLTVIDLGDMQALLGADVKRPYWRSGGWSASAAPISD